MKKFLTILAIFASLLNTKAQAPASRIMGTVTDGSQKTIESATIALVRAKDSVTIKYAVADKTGKFFFEQIKEGKYFVSISAVGHQPGYSSLIDFRGLDIQLPVIELLPQSKAMAAVIITGRKPMIEQKIDRMVVNVDASPSNAGASALEVLEKTPGITVDKDGNISLKGKQGVVVMMDGRPSYLSGADLANYLRGLPASSLDQIEIMTNPSAKYDAAGNSGVINIKVKKNRQGGFNGNITSSYTQWKYARTSNNLNLNYRTGKVNLFASGGFNIWNSNNDLSINRQFKDPSTKEVTAIFDQLTHMRNHNQYNSLKLGADYFLSKKTTLGMVASGFANPSRFNSTSTSYLKNSNEIIDSIVSAQSKINSDWKNGSLNLNFRHEFDSTGRELTSDLDYIAYRSNSSQNFVNSTFEPDWTSKHKENLRGALPVDVDIYVVKVDYAQNFKNGVKFESGLKTSHVRTDNEANYYNLQNGGETIDYSKTNHFLYREHIYAGYINFNRQYKKIGVQLGLRYERTSYSGDQYGNPIRPDSSFKKTYGSLFPTAFFSYHANKNNEFGLSFGRRIDRPAYRDLNPFLFFLDKYTYQAGNPFLRPQFTNNFELTHTYKGMLTTTLNFSRTIDYMNETFEQEKDVNGTRGYATIVRDGNIGRRDAAGVSVNAQIPVGKWWTAMIYTNYNYNIFRGRLNGNGEMINIDASNLMFNVNNQFKFNKGWSGEVSGFYRTKGVDGQIIMQPMGMLSAGISKQVLKTKGNLKLNVRDILYTNKAEGHINFENTMAHFWNTRDSRVATISFTYRFGKPIKGAQQKRKIGGADEEQNRVKMGN